jgi:hypothetical protein
MDRRLIVPVMQKPTAERVAELLLKHDPMQLYFPEHGNVDEYSPEARDIAVRLHMCTSAAQCLDLLHSTFVRFFGADMAGERDRYVSAASDVWALRQTL